MPDHSPSTDERASLTQPSQSSSPLECTSHLTWTTLLMVECRRIMGSTETVLKDAGSRGILGEAPRRPGRRVAPKHVDRDFGRVAEVRAAPHCAGTSPAPVKFCSAEPLLEMWPEKPILPKPSFSYRRLSM